MKTSARITYMKGLALTIILALPITLATAEENPVSLRGSVDLDQTGHAHELRDQNVGQRFQRAYRQQPPLIPHRIEKYQINLKVNQCLRCHDWPYNVEEGAPKVSETHYISRTGVALDRVASTRWFCTQCHVPQVRARALVPNTFKSAVDTE
jgi:cytochrome c-type protein NapB